MATKLGIYNEALRLIGERSLSSVSENREPRRVLDEVYDQALDYCLEQGYFNFAMRSAELSASLTVEPAFGYTYAFEKPSDWIRTAALSAGDTFATPLREYNDETGYFLAHVDPLYVRYVSNDGDYGLDLTRWPETFTKYVATHIAAEICERLTQNASKHEELRRLEKRRLVDARSKDAMNDPVGRLPTGSWVNSRGGFAQKYNRA
jgi:hypothetical protein